MIQEIELNGVEIEVQITTEKFTKVTLNGVKVKVEITKEMARKVLEESEEIEVGDEYYCTNSCGELEEGTYTGRFDEYRNNIDNYLSKRKYTKDQAKEYFDKRDARRAAEYRIKKAIEKQHAPIVNPKIEVEICYIRNMSNFELDYLVDNDFSTTPQHLKMDRSIKDYMFEHHREDYKIYFGIE